MADALGILWLVVGMLAAGLNLWIAVAASRRPDWVHRRAGGTRATWIGLGTAGALVGTCLMPLALPLPIVWLASYRRRLDVAERLGRPGAGVTLPPHLLRPPAPPPPFDRRA